MRMTLAILAASTALTAAIGFPAWSALRPHADDESAILRDEPLPLMLASGGDDDDQRRRRTSRPRDDDDDDDDDDADDVHDDDGPARSPAPGGTVVPPPNGLFGTGAPPKVQVN